MVIVPLHRLLVKPFDFNEWDEGRKKAKELGLALPELENERRAKMSVDMGEILQIGSTAFKDFGADKPPVKVGDTIAFVKNAGKLIKDPFSEKEYLIINDEDVVAIFYKE